MTTHERIFQFKVSLLGITLLIWRQIQVPESYSLWSLHVAIQDAMGWKDYHLHLFQVDNPVTGYAESIGIPDNEGFIDDPPTLPGWELAIADYFTQPGSSARYEYDFGDDWQHEVLFENILHREEHLDYPQCLAGAQACPPENCGGVHGFTELLEALRNPAHEEHQTMMEWIGTEYDPNAFNPEDVHFADPQERWNIAFGQEL